MRIARTHTNTRRSKHYHRIFNAKVTRSITNSLEGLFFFSGCYWRSSVAYEPHIDQMLRAIDLIAFVLQWGTTSLKNGHSWSHGVCWWLCAWVFLWELKYVSYKNQWPLPGKLFSTRSLLWGESRGLSSHRSTVTLLSKAKRNPCVWSSV